MKTWTSHHLFFRKSRTRSEDEQSTLAKVGKIFQIPHSSSPREFRRMLFSLFYTAAVTFPFVDTLVHWLVLQNFRFENLPCLNILVDHGHAFDGTLEKAFILVNINAINSLVALFEILILSSVRKQMVRESSWSIKPELLMKMTGFGRTHCWTPDHDGSLHCLDCHWPPAYR